MKVWKLVNFSKKILASKSKILREKPKFYESSHLSLNSSKTLKIEMENSFKGKRGNRNDTGLV